MSNRIFINKVIAALREILPGDSGVIALHEPAFEGGDWEKVRHCLDTGWVSYAGEFVQEFDRMLAAFCGVKHAISVSSGTAALHVSLGLIGVQRNDEVLLPALTFVASANALSYLGAQPHFVDSCPETLGPDIARIQEYLEGIAFINDRGECMNKHTGRRIVAIMPVHVFGHPADMKKVQDLAKRWNLKIVEDAAEALGSLYKGRPAGSLGDIAALSFNGNKIITTGGGGAILTDNDEIAASARHVTTTAKVKHPWRFMHDRVAYNYRMPNINAALGCAQMERIDGLLVAKRRLAAQYEEIFSNFDGLRFFKEPEYAKSNYWLNALLLNEETAAELEKILKETNEMGIMTRPVWDLMNSLPMYQDCPSMNLEVATNLSKRLINIPSSPFLAA